MEWSCKTGVRTCRADHQCVPVSGVDPSLLASRLMIPDPQYVTEGDYLRLPPPPCIDTRHHNRYDLYLTLNLGQAIGTIASASYEHGRARPVNPSGTAGVLFHGRPRMWASRWGNEFQWRTWECPSLGTGTLRSISTRYRKLCVSLT